MKKKGGSDADAVQFLSKLYKNVPVLATGGRGASSAFLQRNIGDVLVTFESEVISINREFGEGKVDVVYPSVSILVENPVAVVERTVAKKHTEALAKAYLDYLYSDEAQEIAVKHALRPRSPAILKAHSGSFQADRTVHGAGVLREPGRGPEGAFQRRRAVRQDLHGRQVDE